MWACPGHRSHSVRWLWSGLHAGTAPVIGTGSGLVPRRCPRPTVLSTPLLCPLCSNLAFIKDPDGYWIGESPSGGVAAGVASQQGRSVCAQALASHPGYGPLKSMPVAAGPPVENLNTSGCRDTDPQQRPAVHRLARQQGVEGAGRRPLHGQQARHGRRSQELSLLHVGAAVLLGCSVRCSSHFRILESVVHNLGSTDVWSSIHQANHVMVCGEQVARN